MQERLFGILHLLVLRGRMTTAELAAHFEVSSRTIRRAVCGARPRRGRAAGGRVRIRPVALEPAGAGRPPGRAAEPRRRALSSGRRGAGQAARALRRARGAVDRRGLLRLEQPAPQPLPRPAPRDPGAPRRRLHLFQRPRRGARAHGGAPAAPVQGPCLVPAGALPLGAGPAPVQADADGGRAAPGGALFAQRAAAGGRAPAAARMRGAGDEQRQRQPDGSFLVRVRYPVDAWLVGYLLSFGPEAEVLEPPCLREAVREALQKAADRYGK